MSDKPLNLVVFGVDSLRADHISCYGYPRWTTPHIDRLASGGVLFENAYSAYIPTTPAYAAMLTGMDTFTTQVVALGHRGQLDPKTGKHDGQLTSTVKTLPEILRKSVLPPASPLYKTNLTIGRDLRNDVVVPDPNVSEWHLHVGCRNGKVAVSNLCGTKGIVVNGREVAIGTTTIVFHQRKGARTK